VLSEDSEFSEFSEGSEFSEFSELSELSEFSPAMVTLDARSLWLSVLSFTAKNYFAVSKGGFY